MRRLTIAAVATTLLIAGSAGLVHLRSDHAWSTMQQRLAELERQWEQRDWSRDPLCGAATDDDALPHYARALQLAHDLREPDEKALLGTLPHRDDGKVAGTAPLLGRWQSALDELRAGARAQRCRRTPRDFASHVTNLLDARWLCNVAVLSARADRLAGNGRAAVERTLDAMQFGADHMRSDLLIDQMIGAAMLTIATLEAWPDAALSQVDDGALTLLADGLRRVDAALPCVPDLQGELLAFGRTLRAEPDDLAKDCWRYGFSRRWLYADAFLTLVDVFAGPDGDPADWPRREVAWQQRLAPLASSANPLTAICAPNLRSAELTWRRAQCELRLLRVAVAFHRGEAALELADPLGHGPLQVVRGADGTTVRCTATGTGAPRERVVTVR